MMNDYLNAVLQNARAGSKKREGDYEKDGLLYCGKCHEPREAVIDLLPDAEGNVQQTRVPIVCRCDKEKDALEAEREARERFETSLRRLRTVVGAEDAKWDFSQDSAPHSKISTTLRRYAEKWEEMKRDNMGILLYGSKGTGKSFYASCLVNAAEAQMQTSAMVTTAGLMSTLQGSWDRKEIVDALCRFRLLVLDDLGAERDTSYSAELMYSVIDARYRAALPTVVTTNLDLADMKAETDLWRSRIYDRIIEMCPITIKMLGDSRRIELADERKQKAREMLKGAANGD